MAECRVEASRPRSLSQVEFRAVSHLNLRHCPLGQAYEMTPLRNPQVAAGCDFEGNQL